MQERPPTRARRDRFLCEHATSRDARASRAAPAEGRQGKFQEPEVSRYCHDDASCDLLHALELPEALFQELAEDQPLAPDH